MTHAAEISNLPVSFQAAAQLATSRNRRLLCVLLAVLMHLPALPYSRFLSFGWFEPADDEAGEAVIPLDLTMGPGEFVEIDTPAPSPDPPVGEPSPTGSEPVPSVPDAGPPPDAAPELPDAGPDAADDAGPDAAPPKPNPSREPIAKTDISRKLGKNPNNVQIVLVGKRLREHPVGAKMGALLPTIKQWAPFFKDSGINPVTDIEAMVITGPQMRISGDVIAIMKFSTSMDTVKTAIEGIVSRDPKAGRWLEGLDLPVAIARVDRANRLMILVPDQKLLYVVPHPKRLGPDKKLSDEDWEKKLKKQVAEHVARIKKARFTDYSNEPYAIDAYMIEPYKLISKTGEIDTGLLKVQVIPQSLKSMRLVVVPKTSEADVVLTFLAKDAETAPLEMRDLKAAWPLAQAGARMKLDIDLPDITWEVDGDAVIGKATFSEPLLNKVFSMGEKRAAEVREKEKDD